MQTATLLLLAVMVTAAYAAGQYYVPRSYYVIDSDGHESEPVPLRRMRRSLDPYPYLNRRGIRSPLHARFRGESTRGGIGKGRYLTAHGGWRSLSDNDSSPRKT